MLRTAAPVLPCLRVLLLLAAARLLGLPAAADPAESLRSEATGPHFRVTCHFEDEALAASALATVEAAWGRATGLFGPPAASELPLAVHLYRNAADYARAEGALTGGAFRANLAFAHHESRTAHVALQPDVSEDVLRVVGLPAQTRRLLVHEAAHLVRYAAMSDYRSHPGWFADGAALWVADRTMQDLGGSPGLAEDPLTSTWILQTRRALQSGAPGLVARTLADDAADLGRHARYAVRALLFTWLAEGPARPDLDRLLARVRAAAPGPSPAERFRAALDATLGAPGLRETLESGFREYVLSWTPRWDQTIRSLEVREGLWVQAAFPDADAAAWRTDAVAPSFTLEASIQILPPATGEMHLLLGRRDGDFVAVAFAADGAVTVRRHRGEGDRWERLAHADGTGPGIDVRRRIGVTAGPGTLSVAIEGEPVLRHTAPGLDLSGPWGVGATRGSTGIWADVRVR